MIDYHGILLKKLEGMSETDIRVFNGNVEDLVVQYIVSSLTVESDLPGAALNVLRSLGALVVEKSTLAEEADRWSSYGVSRYVEEAEESDIEVVEAHLVVRNPS